MSKKFTITIQVEGGNHKVTVKDDAGNEKVGTGCLVVAGGEELYMFGWGHPVVVARALGEGLSQSQGDPWYAAFIEHMCKDMMMRTMPTGKPVDPGGLLERWDVEDAAKVIKDREEKKKAH